jgi:hypothetical protein
VPSDEAMEARLRELMRDPGWSLPSWPDPQTRLAVASRRRRVSRATTATVTAVAAVAAIGLGTLAAFRPAQHSAGYTLPPPGAVGFPLAVYPDRPGPALEHYPGHCPDRAGVQRPTASSRAQTLSVVAGLGRAFSTDLRLSDRAYWPQLRSSWLAGTASSAAAGRVIYSGPLESRNPGYGLADLARIVRTACGDRTARDTWVVVLSRAGEPGARSEFLLLDRRGHVLVWDAT